MLSCPECKKEVDSKECTYCPYCGHEFHKESKRRKTQPVKGEYIPHSPVDVAVPHSGTKSIKKSGLQIALVFVILVLIVLVIHLAMFIDEYERDPPMDDYVSIEVKESDTANFIAKGDFVKGSLNVEYQNEDILITLSDNAAQGYTHFAWTFFDMHHTAQEQSYIRFSDYTGVTLTKGEPSIIWNSPAVGEYRVTVTCYNPLEKDFSEYSGILFYDDIINKVYYWTFEERSYTITVSYWFSEYLRYSTDSVEVSSTIRNGTDYSEITSICEINNVINDMADSLKKAYLKAHPGSSLNDQHFAEFLLTFVNMCFDYPVNKNDPDMYLYGDVDYWAYPMETIYYGMGDCEDTAVLLAVLYKACGYNSAVAMIPGHAIAAVALDDFVGPRSIDNLTLFYENINHETYYGCETITPYSQGVGYVNSQYYHNGNAYYYNNERYYGDYGFYVL